MTPGFEFLATMAQIDETDLFLALPYLLCYARSDMSVANGGFGPGQGLTGASGGYAYGDDDRYSQLKAAPTDLGHRASRSGRV